jgi:hypothetical protein
MNTPETAALHQVLRALDWANCQLGEVVEAIAHRSGVDDPERRQLQAERRRLSALYEALALIHFGVAENGIPAATPTRPQCTPEVAQLAATLRGEGASWADVAAAIDRRTGVHISANTAHRWAMTVSQVEAAPHSAENSATCSALHRSDEPWCPDRSTAARRQKPRLAGESPDRRRL